MSQSLVQLRVELPAYSHSFSVQIYPNANIGDVKKSISEACIGSPKPEGQRLIWKGRCLDDVEKVTDIWTVCAYL
jgi:hypothetical protein